MEGLTPEQCLEDTVGYIVYYSTEKEGTYVQASPLLFSTGWIDYKTDRAATNWYKVRVLDTGGYLSDFSEPILARENVTIELPKTKIPGEESLVAPKLSMRSLQYTVDQGSELRIPFTVSGTQPIFFEISAWHSTGQDVGGITVLEGKNEVLVPETMEAGYYEVTLTALNGAGQAELTFYLNVINVFSDIPEDLTVGWEQTPSVASRTDRAHRKPARSPSNRNPLPTGCWLYGEFHSSDSETGNDPIDPSPCRCRPSPIFSRSSLIVRKDGKLCQ